MCLALPMKVVKIEGESGIVTAGAVKRRANFTLLKDVKVGDYILLHAAFAIAKVKPDEARRTIRMASEISQNIGVR